MDGKVVLLTGAGSGIGRALAVLLARKGAKLVLTGRRRAPLEETAALVARAGTAARVVAGDIADSAHQRAALQEAEAAFGRLDILINNAGNVAAGRLESLAEADIRAMIEIDLLAPILLTRAALPLLRRDGGGMVINIASGLALIGAPFYSVYCAAKGGLSRFGEALRRELQGEGVHVLTAYPGATETPMMATSEVGRTQGPPRDSPETVAAAIVAGIEENALGVVLGGEARRDAIRANALTPEKVDETFAAQKPAMEAAVRKHRAM